MKDLLILFAHLLTTIAKLLGPGGAKTIIADSLLMKQQLLIIIEPGGVRPISRWWTVSCSVSGHCFSAHAISSEPL